MTSPYLRIPIDADQGFPQAVRIALGQRIYVLSFSVTVTDETLLASDKPLSLPRPGAYLVLDVSAEQAQGTRILFHRKLVPSLEYGAHELGLVFTELAVHPRNLNGAGAFGSVVTGGVVTRWAS
ncbi:hypothetical protein [Nocardia terpenica]|uniref:Uncharacterized protein n=1 Tax=Nocardia terpenica TaxID=455432 RepID=A0A6G9Z2M2_9NOCA|nr:hypothetical protein [Nocardia terpenica]QIS19631.1 hypothetical protein F6W96_16395 [Nocardia terpenica]